MSDFEIEVKFVPIFKSKEDRRKFLEYLRPTMKPRAQWYTEDKNPIRISYRNGKHKFTAKFDSGIQYSRIEIEKEIEVDAAKVLVEQHCRTWVLKNHGNWRLTGGENMEINHFLRAKNADKLPIVFEVEYRNKNFDVEKTRKHIQEDFSIWVKDVKVVASDDHSLDNFNLSIPMEKNDKFIHDDVDAMEAAIPFE